MLPKADLHIHTTSSDGRLSPKEAVQLACDKKLEALAITDHDTFEGYTLAKDFAAEKEIELIPGVEITTLFKGGECHLLAYYFDTSSQYFKDFVLKQRFARKERIKVIIEILNKQGIDVDYDEVWAIANGANIGRPHLASVLINKGYVSSKHEAFLRYLSNERLGDFESAYPDVKDAINIVKEVGGAAIVAHPGRFYSQEEIEELVELGVDGIECIHPSHNWQKQLSYTEFCDKKALLKTGGSDYHGAYESGNTHVGVITIAYKHVEKMKRMTDQRKSIIKLKD
tara:strand:- start:2167 stop:3018 length:852 start_codon:yes stop_codon:yes gene_type:complete